MQKVLVVDDSPLICEWVQATLSSHRIECQTHTIPFGVYRIAAQDKPDLVILDINMPGLNGTVVCRILKQTKPNLRVVFHSSLPFDQLAQATREAGADGYIEKTQNAAMFSMKVRSFLMHRQPAAAGA